MLETCTKDGADQELPLQTPSDYLLNMYELPRSPFRTKEYSFLDYPRVWPFQALSSFSCEQYCQLPDACTNSTGRVDHDRTESVLVRSL